MPHSIIQIHHMIPRWVLACNGAGAIPHCRINDKRPKWWLEKRRVLCDVTCAFFCPSRKVQYFCYVQSEWLVATKIQSNTGQWPHMIRGNTVHILYFWPFSVLLPFFVEKNGHRPGHPDDFTKWTEIWPLRMARCRHVPPMPQSLWFKVCCLLLGAPCLYTRSYLDDKNFYEAVEWMLFIPFLQEWTLTIIGQTWIISCYIYL